MIKCLSSYFSGVFYFKCPSSTVKSLPHQHLLFVLGEHTFKWIKCLKKLMTETSSFQMNKLLILTGNSSLLSLYLASVHIVLSVWPSVEEVTETKRVAEGLKHKWTSVCCPEQGTLCLLRRAIGLIQTGLFHWLFDGDLSGLRNLCFSALIYLSWTLLYTTSGINQLCVVLGRSEAHYCLFHVH